MADLIEELIDRDGLLRVLEQRRAGRTLRALLDDLNGPLPVGRRIGLSFLHRVMAGSALPGNKLPAALGYHKTGPMYRQDRGGK